MTSSNDILFEQKGGVGVLTLNRPDRLNSLSNQMVVTASGIVSKLVAERSVRALVVTGAGRGFCSGADLATDTRFEDSAGRLADQMRGGLNRFVLQLVEAPFPVICAVNGPAAGAGVGIALAGDFLVAAESMKLLLSFARIGMGLDGGTSVFLPELIGRKRAAAAAMLMEPIDAALAQEWGIAWKVAPDEQLMDIALELAERLAQGAPLAFAAIKRQMKLSRQMSLQEALDYEAGVQGELIATEDLKEGVAAFRDRRPAQFRGA